MDCSTPVGYKSSSTKVMSHFSTYKSNHRKATGKRRQYQVETLIFAFIILAVFGIMAWVMAFIGSRFGERQS
jgi:hypothetical protein